MSRHTYLLVESIKVIPISDGRSIRIRRDRTKENLKTNYGDGDIHLTCVAQAHDPIEMIKTLARLENVRSVELIDAKGNGIQIHKEHP
jgi:hypothetical protein